MSSRTYPCLIVDDEPIARSIVAKYITQMPNLEGVGQFKNAIEALAFLENQTTPAILFLDINMPNLSGLSMAKILKPEHKVIFTTAYAEYAVQSYEFNAVDYLLKPFTFERFAQAVFKATERLNSSSIPANVRGEEVLKSTIYIKARGENFLVPLKEITHCEAKKNYTKVFMTEEKTYSTLVSISKFEEELNSASSRFLRIHRSFIISRDHISSIGANYVMIAQTKIPIGPQYKASFFKQFNIG